MVNNGQLLPQQNSYQTVKWRANETGVVWEEPEGKGLHPAVEDLEEIPDLEKPDSIMVTHLEKPTPTAITQVLMNRFAPDQV